MKLLLVALIAIGCAGTGSQRMAPALPADVIGTPETDAAALAVLTETPAGKAVEVGGVLCPAADGSLERRHHATGTGGEVTVSFKRSERCVAMYHTHPRMAQLAANRKNRLPSMPTNWRKDGGSDATAVQMGLPNYYRDPFGDVRVLEYRGGYRVRTVRGERLAGETDSGLAL